MFHDLKLTDQIKYTQKFKNALFNINFTIPIIQILIYSKNCPHCQASLPIWEEMGNIIKNHTKNYYYTKIEIREKLSRNKTGFDVYQHFQSTGVPFVLQNFKTKTFEKNVFTIESQWHISYIGEIQPFRFLSESFKIKNPLF